MLNEGIKYLKDILSNKLHSQKYNFNTNDYLIIQLSVQQAFNIVMEINEIENIIESLNYDYKRLTEEYKRDIEIANKYHKILSIIKKKNVGTRALKYYIEVNESIALNVYNSYVDGRDKQLTEEEYNLLKEELKDAK